jgi:hypothetical protein
MGGALGGKGSSTNEPNANVSNESTANSSTSAVLRNVMGDGPVLLSFWIIRIRNGLRDSES